MDKIFVRLSFNKIKKREIEVALQAKNILGDIQRVCIRCVTKKGFTNRQLILKQLYHYSTIN